MRITSRCECTNGAQIVQDRPQDRQLLCDENAGTDGGTHASRTPSNARGLAGHDPGLIAEQRLDVMAAPQHAQDQDTVIVNAVRNHLVPDHETAHAWPQVFVAPTTNVRLAGEECEPGRDPSRSRGPQLRCYCFGLRGSTRCRPGRIRLAVRRGNPSARCRALSRQSPASALLDVLRERLHRVFRNESAFATCQ